MDKISDRLTERGHWDALFKGVELPRKLDFSQHHYRACAEFMRPFLEQRRGGVLLTLVPNMGGASGWLNRLAVPDVFDMHVRLDRAELGSAHSDTGLKLLRCDYAGVFSLAVVPWARSRKAFFLARPVLSLINYSNALLSRACNVMPEFGTALLSPYIMAAALRDGK